jgi:hypothetical protein
VRCEGLEKPASTVRAARCTATLDPDHGLRDFFLLGSSSCSRCLLLFRWPAPRGGWGREVGGEGEAPGQARKPGSELGRALFGLCWGPAGNAVGPPARSWPIALGITWGGLVGGREGPPEEPIARDRQPFRAPR